MVAVVTKNIFCLLCVAHSVFFNALFSPYKITIVQISVSSGHRKPGVEKSFFIVLFLKMVHLVCLLFLKTNCRCVTGIPAECEHVIVIGIWFNYPGKNFLAWLYLFLFVQ